MSMELLDQSDLELNTRVAREPDELRAIGGTAFEALAEDSKTAIELPEGIEDPRFTMSVTRYGDGQTVPDEN